MFVGNTFCVFNMLCEILGNSPHRDDGISVYITGYYFKIEHMFKDWMCHNTMGIGSLLLASKDAKKDIVQVWSKPFCNV